MIFALIAPASAYAVTGTITVNLEGTPVDVSFDSEGVEILSVETIDDAFGASLILEVKVTGSPGILEIILERNFIDAKYQGDDDLFFVLVDGEDLNFKETETTSESRTLRITLPEGTEEVEIIGTEFGEPDMMEEETMEEEKEETMEEEEERTQCGPGTVQKEGVCVLEQKCGTGTILQNGVCVVSPSASTGDVSISTDFIVGGGVALVISFILMLVLGAVARASRNKP